MANYFQGKGNTLFSSVQLVLVTIAAFSLFSGCGGDEKFKISGTVTSGGVALPGVTVTLSGEASKQTQTDKDGNYVFDDLSEGKFTVAPSFSGYMFTPPYRTVWIYGLNGVGFNFSGSAEVRMSAKTHTVVLKDDGTVWAWGSNGRGQLGDGTTTDRTSPVQVSGLSGVSAVAAGNEYAVVLKHNGTVWAWGSNSKGQLGDGTTTDRTSPVQVSGLSGAGAVAAGYEYAVVLKHDGTVWAWGNNSKGQLGDGTTTDRTSPVQVSGLSGVTAVAAGFNHTVALRHTALDMQVWAWGSNSSGQLGDGTTTDRSKPVEIKELPDATVVALGYDHTVLLRNDGTVWAWGNNSKGQLGDGTTTNRTSPSQVQGLAGGTAIAAGKEYTVGLKNDNTVWTWGNNSNGQLGDGTTTDRWRPVQVLSF